MSDVHDVYTNQEQLIRDERKKEENFVSRVYRRVSTVSIWLERKCIKHKNPVETNTRRRRYQFFIIYVLFD